MDNRTLSLMMGAAGGASKLYVEDVFSTWLYTGNGSTQTITNGIDLSGKGGMVWIKNRNDVNGTNHFLLDTSRGANNYLISNSTAAQGSLSLGWTFNSDGFTQNNNFGALNLSSNTYASWTFRKAAKFFDVVTFTTAASTPTYSFSHALGSTPGCIIIKDINNADDWYVWHRSLDPAYNLALNQTAAQANRGATWITTVNSTTVASSVTGGANPLTANRTYVAYLFAHDAGGFGDSGNDSVVKCGTFTGTTTIDLGWEPQWLLIKRTDSTGSWWIVDTMRGLNVSTDPQALFANLSNAEAATFPNWPPNATGFSSSASGTYIYIAIRSGPMKTPTDATKVFGLNARTGTGANATVTGGQVDDAVLIKNRGSAVGDLFTARLTGAGYLETSSTAAEVAAGTTILQANPWDVMDGIKVGTTSTIANASANTFINYLFRRAPGFFDVVAYTGTGSFTGQSVSHNLGVKPELAFVKVRSTTARNWIAAVQGDGGYLNLDDGFSANIVFLNLTTNSTASTFTVNANAEVGGFGQTYIAYLFASCPGVSKVGSYTGTGTTLNVDCGFTNGARFVLIKRTDSTGAWYIWDTARGIVSGNDPYLLLNSTAAEVTSTDYIDPLSSGFQISSTAPAAINASGGTFIFLAIA